MKPPISQPQTPSQQQPPPPTTTTITTTLATSIPAPSAEPTTANSNSTSTNSITTTTATTTVAPPPILSQPIVVKPQNLATNLVQHAPLALTTQPQVKSHSPKPTVQPTPPQPPQTAASSISNTLQATLPQTISQVPQLQTKIQPSPVFHGKQPTSINTTTATTATTITQSLPSVNATPAVVVATTNTATTASPTPTGPTALVIIPQHPTTTAAVPTSKSVLVSSKLTPIVTNVGATTAHMTIAAAATTQPVPIQSQASITTTHVPNIAPVPITAHQQSTTPIVHPTIANRPPSTLPVIPITASSTPTNVKSEPNKYICCLLDNGVRCDRVAGNGSFNTRIRKIVETKKMNFALDSTARHCYICEHHKAIITVAKKSNPIARETKNQANAKNYTANNNANTLTSQPDLNYTDFSVRQQQQALQHPMNLDLLNNQNRVVNNHTGTLNNVANRQANQISYAHYQGANQNQVGFDNTGGDNASSSSGGVDIDLQQLQVNTLRRYKRHFRVQTRPGLNKMQLAESLKSHFRTLPIIEKEAITYFVYIVKCYRNKLDHNPKAD